MNRQVRGEVNEHLSTLETLHPDDDQVDKATFVISRQVLPGAMVGNHELRATTAGR